MRLVLMVFVAASAAFAQPDTLLRQTFDTDTSGWMVMGKGGSVRVSEGALAFSYELKARQIALAVLPVPDGFARMQRLRFRVKADHDTALVVLLSEKKPGGGNYTAQFWAPANVWQQVELNAADFSAADGPTDPVDADGKLDLDEVEGIGITDMAAFFLAQADNPSFPVAVDAASGMHTVWIDDFEVLGAAGAAHSSSRIDSFDRGYLEWLTMGGVKLKLVGKENPLGMPAMQAEFGASDGRYGLLLRSVANLDLKQATRLVFDIASDRAVTLAVSLETKKGERFNLTIFPPAKKEVFHVNLRLEDFEGDGKMNAGQWKSIAITDITAADGGVAPANTLWIGKMEGVEK
jgi:hypothetical protein